MRHLLLATVLLSSCGWFTRKESAPTPSSSSSSQMEDDEGGEITRDTASEDVEPEDL